MEFHAHSVSQRIPTTRKEKLDGVARLVFDRLCHRTPSYFPMKRTIEKALVAKMGMREFGKLLDRMYKLTGGKGG